MVGLKLEKRDRLSRGLLREAIKESNTHNSLVLSRGLPRETMDTLVKGSH